MTQPMLTEKQGKVLHLLQAYGHGWCSNQTKLLRHSANEETLYVHARTAQALAALGLVTLELGQHGTLAILRSAGLEAGHRHETRVPE